MAVIDAAADGQTIDQSDTKLKSKTGLTSGIYNFLSGLPTWLLWLVVVIWTLPTLSLFVNSFRGRDSPAVRRVLGALPPTKHRR